VRGSDDMFQHFGWYTCRKDYLGHVAAGRKFGCILDLACPGSVPRAFGFRKRRENLLDTYAKIVFRKDACHAVNIVCLGKTKTHRIYDSFGFHRETYGSRRSQYLSCSRYLTNPLFLLIHDYPVTRLHQLPATFLCKFYSSFILRSVPPPATTHPFSSKAPDD